MNPAATRGREWTLATALFAVVLLLALAAYQGTAASLVRTWSGSDSFAHCFLVVPICAVLAWRKRKTLASISPRPYPLALAALPLLGLTWLMGRATDTRLVEQFSFVAMIPALVCAFFGPQVTRTLAFPLGFLFFAVPFGDVFQPTLMDVTADFAVRALRLSGVPAVREGVFLATPVAQWRVAEACSGLHYLVSGFVLACLLAYTSFRRTWKRLAYLALSIVVLILANGMRAYVLILLGHLSEMRLGGGIEHHAVGWIIYIIVMVSIFAAASAFRDAAPPEDNALDFAERARGGSTPGRPGRWISVAGVAVLLLGVWPAFLSYSSRPRPEAHGIPISAPVPRGGWGIEPELRPAWKPAYAGATSETTQAYVKAGARVLCYLAYYENQSEGRELIQHRNVIARPDDPHWRNAGERDRQIQVDQGSLVVRETDVRGPGARFLVWHWYWFPDEFTASSEWAKLLQARASLLLRRDQAAVIVVFGPALDDRDAAGHLRQFVREMLPSIRSALHQADAPP